MSKEKVKDYPDLIKVDKAYIINTDDNAYRAAKARQRMGNQMKDFELRIARLESGVDKIIDILTEKK